MGQSLAGRTAVVTGAGGGIGRCVSLALAREGAAVVVDDLGCDTHGNGSSPEPAARVVAQIEAEGGRAVATTASVWADGGPDEIVATALDAFGGLDVLIQTAGAVVAGGGELIGMSEAEEWVPTVSSHVLGQMACARAAIPVIRDQGRGRIVTFTSGAGHVRVSSPGAYALAKRAAAAFTVALAEELAGTGITVNAISPLVATRSSGIDMLPAGMPVPDHLRALAPPEAIAPLAVFLASDRSADVTGRILFMNGTEVSSVVLGTWLEEVRLDPGGGLGDRLDDVVGVVFGPAAAADRSSGGGAARYALADVTRGAVHAMTRVLVVGEQDGLARAVARRALARGDDVAVATLAGDGPADAGTHAIDPPGGWRTFADSEALVERAHEVLGGVDVVVGLTGGRAEAPFTETDPDELGGWVLDPMARHVGLVRAAVSRWERAGAAGTVISVHHTVGEGPRRPVFGTMVTETLAHLARLYETIRPGVHRAYAVDLRGDDRAAAAGLATVLDVVDADGEGVLAGRLMRSDGEFLGLYSHPAVERTVTSPEPWGVDDLPVAVERLLGSLRR